MIEGDEHLKFPKSDHVQSWKNINNRSKWEMHSEAKIISINTK